VLLKRLCRALRSLFNWKGVGRLQTANHPWYRKYEEASIILFYFSIPNCVFIDSVRLQFLGSIIGSLLLFSECSLNVCNLCALAVLGEHHREFALVP